MDGELVLRGLWRDFAVGAMAWVGIWETTWRFRWPLGKSVTLNADRSVICGDAAHRVRLSQKGEGVVVTVAVAVAATVTTTITTVVEDGVASTVVVSKMVATSVTKVIEVGGNVDEAEEGEREDEIGDKGEVMGTVLDGSLDWVSCEDVVLVGFESEVEETNRGEVVGPVLKGSVYWVNCEDKLVSVAFCVEGIWGWLEVAGAARAT